MRRLEQILVLIALFGILLGHFDIPLGGVATFVGMLLLAMYYFPFGILTLNKVTLSKLFKEGPEMPGFYWRIGAGFFISTGIIGMLFSMKEWPMASQMLLMAALGMLLFILIKVIFGKQKIRILDIVVLSRLGIYMPICVGFYLFY